MDIIDDIIDIIGTIVEAIIKVILMTVFYIILFIDRFKDTVGNIIFGLLAIVAICVIFAGFLLVGGYLESITYEEPQTLKIYKADLGNEGSLNITIINNVDKSYDKTKITVYYMEGKEESLRCNVEYSHCWDQYFSWAGSGEILSNNKEENNFHISEHGWYSTGGVGSSSLDIKIVLYYDNETVDSIFLSDNDRIYSCYDCSKEYIEGSKRNKEELVKFFHLK